MQIYTKQNGANLNELSKALSYLKYALSNNIPVIVGVDAENGSPNPDTDNTTDHFVVVVGMGTDSKGNYFQVYDNASGIKPLRYGANPENKLYYDNATGLITGRTYTAYSQDLGKYPYIVTMVRKSKLIN